MRIIYLPLMFACIFDLHDGTTCLFSLLVRFCTSIVIEMGNLQTHKDVIYDHLNLL